jgi:hypothetical protein
MSVTLGVTLYSMTNEWLAGRYTLPGLVDEVGRRGLGPGVEVIGFQSLRGFPDKVDPADLRRPARGDRPERPDPDVAGQ